MRQNAAAQADGNAFHALGEQERELHRQGHGFFVASVVAGGPLGDFRSKDDVEREFRQAGFDVSGRGGVVAGEDVAPVALRVDEQVFLAELHHGIANAGVTMRMVLHRVADDVGDLVVTAVFQLVHAVQDAALHGLEAIMNVRHGALQDDVAGVVEEPVAIEIVHRLDLDGRAVREDG